MKKGNVTEGYTDYDIVREFFPDATDDDAGYILWNHTGYPCFWGQGGRKTVAGSMRYSLRKFKKACDMGKVLCEICTRRIKPSATSFDLCPSCNIRTLTRPQ